MLGWGSIILGDLRRLYGMVGWGSVIRGDLRRS